MPREILYLKVYKEMVVGLNLHKQTLSQALVIYFFAATAMITVNKW